MDEISDEDIRAAIGRLDDFVLSEILRTKASPGELQAALTVLRDEADPGSMQAASAQASARMRRLVDLLAVAADSASSP